MCQDRAKPLWVFAVLKVLCVNNYNKGLVLINLEYVRNTYRILNINNLAKLKIRFYNYKILLKI